MISYTCGKCGERLESPVSLAGQEDTCPVCGHGFIVPERTSRLPIVLAISGGAGALVMGVILVVALWPDSSPAPEVGESQLQQSLAAHHSESESGAKAEPSPSAAGKEGDGSKRHKSVAPVEHPPAVSRLPSLPEIQEPPAGAKEHDGAKLHKPVAPMEHAPLASKLPSLPELQEPPASAMEWLGGKKQEARYRFIKSNYTKNPVGVFFVIRELGNTKAAPDPLSAWAKTQTSAMLAHIKAQIQADVQAGVRDRDLRKQYIATRALFYTDPDVYEHEIGGAKQSAPEWATATGELARSLSKLIQAAERGETSTPYVWKASFEKVERVWSYVEKAGLDHTLSIRAPENHTFLHLRGKLVNATNELDLPYAIWSADPDEAAVIALTNEIFKKGAIPKNARLVTREDFLVLSEAGPHMCTVVGRECDFLGVFGFLRALGKCSNPTASSGIFLKPGESCTFDLYFTVPMTQKEFKLIVWGTPPVDVPMPPSTAQ